MRVSVVVLVLGLSALAHADTTPPDERIEAARKAVLDDSYQKQLPRYEYEPGFGSGAGMGSGDGMQNGGDRMNGDPQRWRGARRRANGGIGGPDDDGRWVDTREQKPEQQEVSGLMQFLMWGMLIVLAVLFAVWIGSELTKYGGDAEIKADEAKGDVQFAVDAIIEKPLGDADELARRGEFAEAIHTLLLRTLQELVKSSAVRVAPAMTSREILARVPLLAEARDALAGLITAVEITHFGDEPANAADYQRCREQFNVFAQALRTSVRPHQPEAAAA